MSRYMNAAKDRFSGRRDSFLTLLLVIPIIGLIGESAWAWPQNSELVSQLKSQGIPIESIQVKNGTVTARLAYKTGGDFTPDRFEKEMLPLFGKLSERFPEADKIALESLVEGKTIGTLECPAKKALALAKGQITGAELLSSARFTGSLNVEEELAAAMSSQTPPPEKESPGDQLPEKIREGTERRVTSQVARRTASSATPSGGASGMAGGIKPTVRIPRGMLFAFIVLGALCLALFGAVLAMRNKKRKPAPKISARLDVHDRDEGRREFVIHGSRTAIGRAPGNNLVINDPDVSGRHAAINISEGIFVIKDLGSTNGTFLNGRRINREQLYAGDVIAIGGTRIIVGD